jgi:prevent-host-death family protein
MCHNVHMKTISIRELHLKTGQWVRHAASRGPIVVTDRGRRVAALQPFDAFRHRPASPQSRSGDTQAVEGPGRFRRVPVRAARGSVIYFDAAYIAKCYLNEPGADRVREVAYGADGLASCELARLEFASILKRHVRERHVTRREMTAILKDFEADERTVCGGGLV